MNCFLSQVDKEFKELVESCQFPISDFNHQAHLRLAYVYLVQNDTEVSINLMRQSLIRLLAFNGIDPAKYHETLTQAWILKVRYFMNFVEPLGSVEELIDLYPKMLDSNIMLMHYSKDRLFSDEARCAFVQPDLEPF